MTIAQTDEPTPRKPLRLWPGVVAVVLQWLLWFVVPIVAPDAAMFAMLGGVACGLAVVVWWLFFSRAPWSERLGAFVADDRRGGRDTRHPPRVDCDRGDGDDVLHLRHPGPEPRVGRLGGGQPSPLCRTSARGDGRGHPARVRSVDAPADRWHQRRRCPDFAWRWSTDSRGTAPGPSRQDEPTAPPPGSGSGGRQEPTGPAFADRIATASSAACGSRPTGRSRRRSSCGAGRSDRAGRPSRSTATSSTPRSSAVTTRSSPATS